MILGHLSGTLDPRDRDWSARRAANLATEDVVLPGADIHYSLVEAPLSQVQAQLPPSLHPAIPGVLGITFIKCGAGPFGAFEMAVVGVTCRSGIRPRQMTMAAFANSEHAVAELQSRWGFPALLADVQTIVYYDQVKSAVRIGGRAILEVSTGDLTMLTGPGATVVYCPALNMVELEGRKTFVQVDLSAEFKRVARGEPRLGAFDQQALGQIACTPTDPVSGTSVRADLKLHAVRYKLDPDLSAERGGAQKLAAQ